MCLVGSSHCTAALLKLILLTFPMSVTDAVVEVAAGNDSLVDCKGNFSPRRPFSPRSKFLRRLGARLFFAVRLARETSCRCGWETASSGWMAAWDVAATIS